jgi:hypothetical protein
MPIPPISIPDTSTDTPTRTLRILTPAEWPMLAGVFARQGSTLPDASLAQIIVMEEEDEDGMKSLVGFVVLQLVAHIEPIFVTPRLRGTPAWEILARAAVKQFPVGVPYYAFAPSPAIGAMAEKVGLSKQPWDVYHGVNTVVNQEPV